MGGAYTSRDYKEAAIFGAGAIPIPGVSSLSACAGERAAEKALEREAADVALREIEEQAADAARREAGQVC